jgi:hypothetical protein
MRLLIQIVPVAAALALTSGCGDPYSRYAGAVHDDVDASMMTALRMTARLQLTVVHNRIPPESLAVVAKIATRAARDVRASASHFATVTPPADLAEPHVALAAELSTLAQALDSMAAAFRTCADGAACEAHVAAVSSRFAYVGEDLNTARGRVQHSLLPHGVMLPRVTAP